MFDGKDVFTVWGRGDSGANFPTNLAYEAFEQKNVWYVFGAHFKKNLSIMV